MAIVLSHPALPGFSPRASGWRVVSVDKNEIRVKPFSNLDRLEYVKLVNYGLDGILEDEEAGREAK